MPSEEDFDYKGYARLLASIWSGKDKEIQDYGCNAYCEELSKFDNTVDLLGLKKKHPKVINVLRIRLRRRGKAKFLKHSDILTNLATQVPEAGQEETISWSEQ